MIELVKDVYVPDGWEDDWRVQQASRECDPIDDFGGFLACLADIIEDYAPKLEGWLAEHGLTGGQVFDLMEKVKLDPSEEDWKLGLRQLYLAGLDIPIIARMLDVDEESIESYVLSSKHMHEGVRRIRELHAKGMTNKEIQTETGCSLTTIRKALEELGLTKNVKSGSTPEQREHILSLRAHNVPYAQIAAAVGVSLTCVKNTVRAAKKRGDLSA